MHLRQQGRAQFQFSPSLLSLCVVAAPPPPSVPTSKGPASNGTQSSFSCPIEGALDTCCEQSPCISFLVRACDQQGRRKVCIQRSQEAACTRRSAAIDEACVAGNQSSAIMAVPGVRSLAPFQPAATANKLCAWFDAVDENQVALFALRDGSLKGPTFLEKTFPVSWMGLELTATCSGNHHTRYCGGKKAGEVLWNVPLPMCPSRKEASMQQQVNALMNA
jgi:hypothetical protein